MNRSTMRSAVGFPLAVALLSACAGPRPITDVQVSASQAALDQQHMLQANGYVMLENPAASRVSEIGVPGSLNLPSAFPSDPIDLASALGYLGTGGLSVMVSPELSLKAKVKAPFSRVASNYLDEVCRQANCKATVDWIRMAAVIMPYSLIQQPEMTDLTADEQTGSSDLQMLGGEEVHGAISSQPIPSILRKLLPQGYAIRSDLPDSKLSQTFDLSYDGTRSDVIHKLEAESKTRVLLYPRLKLAIITMATQ
ncbi:MAG: hypothetical protein E6Q76_14495 [Rhizobium sp.]|nr:MAG: hypothetical protein E6Q76_14495 [Rhizobium sp.]